MSSSVLRIGTLFSVIDDKKKVNISQANCLAATLIAVKEINDGAISLNQTIKLAYGNVHRFADTIYSTDSLVKKVFNNAGVSSIIGGADNLETMASNQMLNDFEIVQIHSRAMDADFGNGDKYHYKIQTVPIDSYQGMVFQHILCHTYRYQKIAVFFSDTLFGAKAAMESSDDTYCSLERLFSASIRTSDDNDAIDIHISRAIVSGAKIFLIFMTEFDLAKRVLKRGYYGGLFKKETQIFVPAQLASKKLWDNSGEEVIPEDIVPILLNGLISIEYIPNYSILSDKGKDFFHKFKEQNVTFGTHSSCDVYLENTYFPDTPPFTNTTDGSGCTYFNFTGFNNFTDGFDIDAYASHAYDATYGLALAYKDIQTNGLNVTGENIHETLMLNVSYVGASGEIDYFEGMPDYGYYAMGDREIGHHYKILNFQPQHYKEKGLVTVGIWSPVEESIINWTDSLWATKEQIYPVVYNTHDNQPPLDHSPDTVHLMPVGGVGFLLAMAALTILMNIFYFYFVVKFRNSKLIKASQPAMLYFILVGGFLAGIRIIIATLDITDDTCTAGIWIGHLAFVFGFGAMFLKTWRVDKIVNNKSLKRIKITNLDILKIMSAVIIFFVIYLAVMTGVGKIHKSVRIEDVSNHRDLYESCGFKHPEFHTALFALEAVIMIYGVKLCWATKDVPDAVNESKVIASAMTFMFMLMILVFPIIFLLDLIPYVNQIIASLSFAIGNMVAASLLFVPKALLLFAGEDVDLTGQVKNHKINKNAKDNRNKVAVTSDNAAEEDSEPIFANLKEAFSNKSLDQRSQICRTQIEKWRAMLLQIESRESSNSKESSVANKSVVSNTNDVNDDKDIEKVMKYAPTLDENI